MKPNRYESKDLAEQVTDEDLVAMFENAKVKVTDWTVRSTLNKGMTKGAAYNILKLVSAKSHKVGISNAIREFGEYLPEPILALIKRKGKPILPKAYHEDPKFD